ncbi:hypothetical protein E4U55_000301 [Claviceps digitariae]|nr:hypothetical protein E4U55_000301 [Claviceps digitariae]
MLPNLSTTLMGLTAAAVVVSAQTYSSCDPTKRGDCPPNPALGTPSASCSFSRDPCGLFSPLDGSSTSLSYGPHGAVFSIQREGQAPTVQTGRYIFFGRVEAVVQAAPGRGIVTSVVLQSNDLDEIDWEWIGSDDSQVQTNYFSKGNTTTYDRGQFHPVANPVSSPHTYALEWTRHKITWSIDRRPVRTLLARDVLPASFPQTPMQVKLGTWVAGRVGAAAGTVEWAGGYADWSRGPFSAYYKSVSVTDYAGGDGPDGRVASRYVWEDGSGTWESIRVE